MRSEPDRAVAQVTATGAVIGAGGSDGSVRKPDTGWQERRPRRGRVVLGAGALLAAVLALLFWRGVFQDRVLAPADIVFRTPFYAHVAPPGFSQPVNPLLYDQAYQFAPWRHFTRVSLFAGELPLWNPYSLAGTPLVATQQSAVFYPINLLLLALPYERTFVWSAILRLWTAGILMFLLARRLGLPPVSGLIAAFAFMLSGFLVVGIGHPHTGVALWLPGIALGAELALAARTRAAVLRAVGLLALIVGVQFTGGHLETSVDMLLAVGLYLVIRWWQLGRRPAGATRASVQPLLVFAGGTGLGVGVGAVQLLPFLQWLPLSQEAGVRAAAGSFAWFDPSWWKQLLFLPLFVFPNLYNRPTWAQPYFDFLPWGRNYHADMVYVGVLPFLLALVALVFAWRSTPVVRAWAIVGFIAFGRALSLPVFDWLNHLPLLDLSKPHMLRLVASFAVCVLAGFGAAALFAGARDGAGARDDTGRAGRLWLGLCAGVVLAGAVVMLAGKFALPAFRDRLVAIDRGLAANLEQSIGGAARPTPELARTAERMAGNTIMAFRLRNVAMYAPAIFAAGALLLGWAARRRRRWPPALRAALLALVAGDLTAFAWGYNPAVPRAYFYPAPPIIDTLQRDTTLYRFSATVRDLTADAHMMYDLSDIRGLDFPTRWYATYAKLAPEHVAWRKITFDGFDSPLLRVLNLKYVYARDGRVPLAADRVARTVPAGAGRLWVIRNPAPRSFMVYRAHAVESDSEAAGLLRREPERVFSRVLLAVAPGESPPAPADTGMADADAAGGLAGRVGVVEYGPRRSAWRVRTDRPGYLFTSDAYYPGWTAELDGRATRLYRANIAFRAVRVPAGNHVVAYRFDPVSVRIGLAVSTVSLLAAALLLMAARVGGEPRARPPPGQ